MKVLLAIKDEQGTIYTMPSENGQCILEVGYCTSYLDFEVQSEVEVDGKMTYPTKNLYVLTEHPNPVDLIAIQGAERGYIIEGGMKYETK